MFQMVAKWRSFKELYDDELYLATTSKVVGHEPPTKSDVHHRVRNKSHPYGSVFFEGSRCSMC